MNPIFTHSASSSHLPIFFDRFLFLFPPIASSSRFIPRSKPSTHGLLIFSLPLPLTLPSTETNGLLEKNTSDGDGKQGRCRRWRLCFNFLGFVPCVASVEKIQQDNRNSVKVRVVLSARRIEWRT
ncbi:uncharacterized protein LOC129307777 [Prosopis cineraria]|uniref:uncharacterized protein LOC129307777 n=1 Tax=Prosopis cineraria TaxID=364024 RepID=UPI00240F66DD|nr:uncharacterized protein LOC129307777 [Prosopis cineraria]